MNSTAASAYIFFAFRASVLIRQALVAYSGNLEIENKESRLSCTCIIMRHISTGFLDLPGLRALKAFQNHKVSTIIGSYAQSNLSGADPGKNSEHFSY